jgi:hypothetical protein
MYGCLNFPPAYESQKYTENRIYELCNKTQRCTSLTDGDATPFPQQMGMGEEVNYR